MACADLAGRSGAIDFALGYVHEDVPSEDAGWYAVARFQGARIQTDEHRSPSTAALALAERLLRDAMCVCRRRVVLSDAVDGCRWRLVGARWEPGCDAPPIRVAGARGDIAGMHQLMDGLLEEDHRQGQVQKRRVSRERQRKRRRR